ncbi:hypothetical protein NO1_1630 [Candidatus Termititenax aidoneus]|uniref:Uncharacterized protein n=1 Tax=Termititenax aidoneus TaxID=2218524 RepID=A0A388TDG2_TERA1|nr:hypothetical protein NO1_1630 [Candidatus Termititenax aidoneus]
MKRAYSYLELVITLGILALIFGFFLFWQRGYTRGMREAVEYYRERETILNRIELNQADNVSDFSGLKKYELIWRGKKIIWLN